MKRLKHQLRRVLQPYKAHVVTKAVARATTCPHSAFVTVLDLNGGLESWNEGCIAASFCHSGLMSLLTTHPAVPEASVSKLFRYETKFMTDQDFLKEVRKQHCSNNKQLSPYGFAWKNNKEDSACWS